MTRRCLDDRYDYHLRMVILGDAIYCHREKRRRRSHRKTEALKTEIIVLSIEIDGNGNETRQSSLLHVFFSLSLFLP